MAPPNRTLHRRRGSFTLFGTDSLKTRIVIPRHLIRSLESAETPLIIHSSNQFAEL